MSRHFGGRSHAGPMPHINPRVTRMPNPRRQFNRDPVLAATPVPPVVKHDPRNIVMPYVPNIQKQSSQPSTPELFVLPPQVSVAPPKPLPDIPRRIGDCVISNNFTRKGVKEFTTNIWATNKTYINVTKLFKEGDVIVSAMITGIKGERKYIVGLARTFDSDPLDILIPKCTIPSINSYENQANFDVRANTCLVIKCSDENTSVPLALNIVYMRD